MILKIVRNIKMFIINLNLNKLEFNFLYYLFYLLNKLVIFIFILKLFFLILEIMIIFKFSLNYAK
jgi:hypothetical protein